MPKTRRTLAPGQRGTKKLVEQYGARLVCVRYRYDEQKGSRYKTVELIVAETAWKPPQAKIKSESVVGVRIGVKEVELQRKVRQAGGRWNLQRRLWGLRYDRVVELGLEARVERDEASNIRNPKSF